MIKDVHINSPKPFLRGIEFRADAAHSLRASEITDILEAVEAGKIERFRSRAMLVIASFIIHFLSWQACKKLGKLGAFVPHWRLFAQVGAI